jgi:hypothetical protein
MKKFALLTLTIGDHYQNLSKITYPTLKRYAEKIGADFIPITEQKISQTTPHWEKFQILDYLNKYERIIYVDTDILIRKNCPNLFEIVPESKLGIYNECPFVPGRDYAILKASEDYGSKDFKWDGKYYNTGVMVISRCHRSLFRKPEKEISNFYEQSYLNLQIQSLKVPVFEIDYKFNRMHCVDKITGKDRFESYIIHYAGVNYSSAGLSIIKKDAEYIESLPDDYQAKKRVWISVQGGLGDQMQAEPTIRYALTKSWPESDLRISTHFPDLFRHLGVPVKNHEEDIWGNLDGEPFSRCTLPGPETIQWKIVSNLMSHTVDFCSMAVLSRILPDIDKEYQLYVPDQAIENVKKFSGRTDFSDCVLFHAGSHWESKSFPVSWWQEVIDGIIESGLTPVLVGKNDDTRGTVKVDGRGKSIDLIDLLTLQEFMAIISLVPILISNDSSPVHIAGAFDNWIILIPTCKHPDHLLPYRNGNKYYKSTALYKRLALDDMVTSVAEMEGSTADKMPGPWEDYLPEPTSVIKKINEIQSKKVDCFV